MTLPSGSKSGVRFNPGTSGALQIRVTAFDVAGNRSEGMRDIGGSTANTTTTTSMSPTTRGPPHDCRDAYGRFGHANPAARFSCPVITEWPSGSPSLLRRPAARLRLPSMPTRFYLRLNLHAPRRGQRRSRSGQGIRPPARRRLKSVAARRSTISPSILAMTWKRRPIGNQPRRSLGDTRRWPHVAEVESERR